MGEEKACTKNISINRIICPLVITIVITTVVSLLYPPTYAINDDMMIDSILSGSFYRIYPYSYYFSGILGAVISLLYTIVRVVPWFGIFIISINALSVFAFEYVAFNRFYGKKNRVLAVVLINAVIAGLFLSNTVLPHYTVVASQAGAAGLALFITSEKEKQFIAPIAFFLITYLIRENVFFMLIPFVGLAFIYLLLVNKERNIRKYIIYALSFFAVFAVLFVTNRGMMSSDKWQEYKQFNDIRTEVYDYVGIAKDEEAVSFYKEKNMSVSDIELLRSYNILLEDSDKIAEELNVIAEYAKERLSFVGMKKQLRKAVEVYVWRVLFEDTDAPYNYLVILLYPLCLIALIVCKQYLQIIPLAFLGIYRNAIWLFLIYKGRYPERVTLSLYILEIVMLLFILLRTLLTNPNEFSKLRTAFCLVTVLAVSAFVVVKDISIVTKTDTEYRAVCDSNSEYEALYSYLSNHKDNYYYLDVFSALYRTEKVLKVHTGTDNYMLLGGWMVKHPLCEERISSTGYSSVKEGLLSDKKTFVVIREGYVTTEDMLNAWMGKEGILVDKVNAGKMVFNIYSFAK